MSSIVTLNWFEAMRGAIVGVQRNVESKKENRKHRENYKGDAWSNDIEGALGEMAFAKYLGVYWTGSVNTFTREPDVLDYEVRTSGFIDPSACLFIGQKESPFKKYVLVIGSCPTYRIVGWILGSDGMHSEYLKDKNGRGEAYYVPQHVLHAFDSADDQDRWRA